MPKNIVIRLSKEHTYRHLHTLCQNDELFTIIDYTDGWQEKDFERIVISDAKAISDGAKSAVIGTVRLLPYDNGTTVMFVNKDAIWHNEISEAGEKLFAQFITRAIEHFTELDLIFHIPGEQMQDLLDEFHRRRSFLYNMNFEEVDQRLLGFWDWLESNETTSFILSQTIDDERIAELLKKADFHHPPAASSPEDFALIGLYFIREVKSGKKLWSFSHTYGIHPSYNTTSIQAMVDEVINRYIDPAIDYLEMRVDEITQRNRNKEFAAKFGIGTESFPPEIKDSLQKFREDHPDTRKTVFIIMQFGKTPAHLNIVKSIKQTFAKHGIVALRADDKEYHNSLLGNVLTYIYGCTMSVAVFERIEADEFNPNVSFEVGYMKALNKPVCLLKDKTMRTLPTDLLGELYKSFDPQDPHGSIPGELEKWLKDKEMV